ncbi:MAG: hypothetical protein NT169_17995 [Chloroflexi bacterium]|nr:hypothetical protein [Chloroflexota bacterium]
MSGFLVDTDILSIFAKANALALLREILGCQRLPITTGVFNEIVIPLEYGYDFPRRVMAVAETVLMSSEEVAVFETLRLEGRVSAADAEIVAICQRRSWIYVTMDRVAARYAEMHGVRSVDLHALLKAALTGGLLAEDQLRALVEQMERADHTVFPFKEEL